MIVALVALLGAVVTGLLGFLYYPAKAKRETGHARAVRKRGGNRGGRRNRARDPELPPEQGMARALFIVFASMALLCGFLWLVL